MIRNAVFSISLLLITMISTFAQDTNFNQIISALDGINQTPSTVVFRNSLEINNQGGHLQGIQCLDYNQHRYFVLSGSSSEYSYYSIVKIGDENRVISINKIMDKPFKHAGGFQIFDGLMAIGVEDNEAKDRSKVLIFHLEDPEITPNEPIAIIDRTGPFKRATAGCVAITEKDRKIVVAVGNWDTEHLDFYTIEREKLVDQGAAFKLRYSLDSKKLDRSSWIDQSWLSYQNINFIKDQSDNLYLSGMAANSSDENVIDLFLVESEDFSTINLRKIYSKTFESNDFTSFRWGAGVCLTGNQNIELISCGANIKDNSLIHIYR